MNSALFIAGYDAFFIGELSFGLHRLSASAVLRIEPRMTFLSAFDFRVYNLTQRAIQAISFNASVA